MLGAVRSAECDYAEWRHDTQHNDIQDNDTQHNYTQRIKLTRDTLHKCVTQHNNALPLC